jgi:hypothetical protein
MTEPWLLPGLPPGLTPQHFDAAAEVWIAHRRRQLGDTDLRPLLGPGGAHFRLSGLHYENTAARAAALIRVSPLLRLSDGAALHPVVLVHDPSPVEGNATPVGVCAVTGYIGSGWNAHADVAAQVSRRGGSRYLVTVVELRTEDYGPEARVWLPTPNTPT